MPIFFAIKIMWVFISTPTITYLVWLLLYAKEAEWTPCMTVSGLKECRKLRLTHWYKQIFTIENYLLQNSMKVFYHVKVHFDLGFNGMHLLNKKIQWEYIILLCHFSNLKITVWLSMIHADDWLIV